MRIPFLAGWFRGSKDRTRIVVAEGRVPRVFPGPWRLEAVVRADEEVGSGEARGTGPDGPGVPHPTPPGAREREAPEEGPPGYPT